MHHKCIFCGGPGNFKMGQMLKRGRTELMSVKMDSCGDCKGKAATVSYLAYKAVKDILIQHGSTVVK
jgi:hypothetical protein